MSKEAYPEEVDHTFGKDNYIIRVCSFNVNSKFGKSDLYDKWLHSEHSADILVVGLQELYFKLMDVVAPESLFHTRVTVGAHRKWINLFSSLKFLKESYTMIATKSFAALCLFIFIKKSRMKNQLQPVSNLMVGSFPLGMLGMANKGGLSISFRFNDLALCFINCHFPSGGENLIKRQQSMQSIIQKLQLHHGEKSKKVNFIEADFDLVFLFGDLNFRLQNVASQYVIDKVRRGRSLDLDDLLRCDELILNREKDALYSSFYEAEISFMPTYKFVLESDQYDSKRVPSFCDRVLWRGDKCVNMSYSFHPEIRISDHRPISAEFFIDSTTKTQKLSKDFTKPRVTPIVKIENTKIDFGDVFFFTNHFCETKVENVGLVKCDITFKNVRSSQSLPTWFTIIPTSFVLEPNSHRVVQFRVFIDNDSVASFNTNKENINCTIVYAAVTNGVSTVIQFQGRYQLSLFGLHLDYFQFLTQPIQGYVFTDMEQFEKLRNEQNFSVCSKQRLLKRILTLLMPKMKLTGSISEVILRQENDFIEMLQLINMTNNLDITASFKALREKRFHEGTYIEVLLIFLKCLPQPLIPFVIQVRLAANPTNNHHVLKILHNLPGTNILILKKISKFFNGFIEKQEDVDFMANFIVTFIPPSSPALKEPLISVLSFLIMKPQML